MTRLRQGLLLFSVSCVMCFCGLTRVHGTETSDDIEEFYEDDSDEFVMTLTPENFDEHVDKNSTILIVFYPARCEHCELFVPMFAAAAQDLAEKSIPVVLAKYNVSEHPEIAEKYDVTNFPSLRFFKDRQEYEYGGKWTQEGIVEYMTQIAEPTWRPDPEAVVTLTMDNFEDVTSIGLVLVQFFDSRMGKQRKLDSLFEKAAAQLIKDMPPIILAKLDAAQEPVLAEKFGVTNFPTFKMFRRGRALDYMGGYDTAFDIINYMKRQARKGPTLITSVRMLKEFIYPDEISICGFFESPDDPLTGPYEDLAINLRDDFNFGIVFDKKIHAAYNIKQDSVVVLAASRFYTKYEPKWFVLEVKDDTTADDIFDFIRDHHLPLVGQYKNPLTNHYDRKRPLCLVFYSVDFSFDHKEATQFWRHKIADVAHQFPDIKFAIADDEELSSLVKEFGLDESGEELNVGLYGADGRKYSLQPEGEFDMDVLVTFLESFKRGELKPYVRSQRPPKNQVGPLAVVVGETFDQIVLDPGKNVLLELYAPWCDHCKQLEVKLSGLAERLQQDSSLVIAKMDASLNDSPDNYKAEGYPTIYLALAGNKTAPLKYEGPRELQDIENFLRENGVAVPLTHDDKKEEL